MGDKDTVAALASHLDEDSISQFLEGSLPVTERQRVRDHAEDCPTCRNVLAAVKSKDPEGTMVDEGESLLISVDPTAPAPRGEANAQDLIGQKVGEYVTEAVLGSGGMGIVYKARHPLIGKTVAIKVLRPELASEPDHVQNLLAEARAASQVSHRSVVDIFSFGSLPDGRQYLVMEYLIGKPLNKIIKEEAPLPVWDVLAYVDAVAAALEAAHEAEIVHRDLKPSNLFIQRDRDGSVHVKLLDFGLARAGAMSGAEKTTASANLLLGTPAYMAPEQVRGETVDARTDLYALGIIAYELSCGMRPYRGDNMFRLMTAHLEDTPQRPTALRPDLPPEIEALILRLLAKTRSERPASAQKLREELRTLKRAYPPPGDTRTSLDAVPARDDNPSSKSTVIKPRPPKRSLAPVLGLGAVLVVVAGVGWLGMRARAAAEDLPAPPAPVVAPPKPVEPPPVAAQPPVEPPAPAPAVEPPAPEPKTPLKTARKAVTKHKTTSGSPAKSLVSRADRLKKRLLAATPTGSDPDAMAVMLIGEARAAASKAKTDDDEAKVEKMLGDIERNYLGGR